MLRVRNENRSVCFEIGTKKARNTTAPPSFFLPVILERMKGGMKISRGQHIGKKELSLNTENWHKNCFI